MRLSTALRCVSGICLFCFVLPTIGFSSDDSKYEPDFAFVRNPSLFALAFASVSYHLSPVAKLEKEIKNLNEDQLFIRRRLLLNTSPELEKRANKVIADLQKQKTEKQKKLKRTRLWFYPAAVAVSTGIIAAISLIRG